MPNAEHVELVVLFLVDRELRGCGLVSSNRHYYPRRGSGWERQSVDARGGRMCATGGGSRTQPRRATSLRSPSSTCTTKVLALASRMSQAASGQSVVIHLDRLFSLAAPAQAAMLRPELVVQSDIAILCATGGPLLPLRFPPCPAPAPDVSPPRGLVLARRGRTNQPLECRVRRRS